MTPNLDKLFEQAGKEPATDDELDRAQAANMVLFDLFQTHGEALVKALKACLIEMNCCNRQLLARRVTEGYTVTAARTNANTLLAAMERDAKEGLRT